LKTSCIGTLLHVIHIIIIIPTVVHIRNKTHFLGEKKKIHRNI